MYRVSGEKYKPYHIVKKGDKIQYDHWKDGVLLTETEPLNGSDYKWIDNLVDVTTQVTKYKHNKLWGLK